MNEQPTLFVYLRGVLILLVLCCAVGGAATAFGWFSLQRAETAHKAALAQRNNALQRIGRASLEEQELRVKIQAYRKLEARGLFGPEKRLDWIERMTQIRNARRLPDLHYELSPQHPVDKTWLPTGPTAATQRFEASTLTLTAGLLHEGDLLALLADIRSQVPAHTALRRCVMTRAQRPERIGGATLDTVCELDWITIQEGT